MLVVQKFLEIDREQAVSVVNDLMTSRVRQFEHVAATELPFVADELGLGTDAQDALDEYVVGLQDWMAGILDWHMLTGRYPEWALRQRYRMPPQRLDGPTGLGTSAAVDLLTRMRGRAQ